MRNYFVYARRWHWFMTLDINFTLLFDIKRFAQHTVTHMFTNDDMKSFMDDPYIRVKGFILKNVQKIFLGFILIWQKKMFSSLIMELLQAWMCEKFVVKMVVKNRKVIFFNTESYTLSLCADYSYHAWKTISTNSLKEKAMAFWMSRLFELKICLN